MLDIWTWFDLRLLNCTQYHCQSEPLSTMPDTQIQLRWSWVLQNHWETPSFKSGMFPASIVHALFCSFMHPMRRQQWKQSSWWQYNMLLHGCAALEQSFACGTALNIYQTAGCRMKKPSLMMVKGVSTCDLEGCTFLRAEGQADTSSKGTRAAASAKITQSIVCAHQG